MTPLVCCPSTGYTLVVISDITQLLLYCYTIYCNGLWWKSFMDFADISKLQNVYYEYCGF